MHEIRYIDLFAGVGGFHKGLQQANDFEETQSKRNKESWTNSSNTNRKPRTQRRSKPTFSCVWANEWDKHAAKVYQARFPETPFFEGDIRTVDANRLPDFDLLCGGFPCQTFSLAGKRKGFNDTRGTLFFEIARILEARRPPLVLLENVKGLLSHENGATFGRIIQVLGELGYWVEWQVLNSKNFGVPQNRERVFIVGHSRDRSFREIFPLRSINEIYDAKQQPTNRQKILRTDFGLQSIQEREKYCNYKRGKLMELTNGESQAHRVYSPDGLSKTIAGNAGGVGAKTGLYAIPCLTPERENKRQHGRRFKEDGEPMFTLTGQDVHGIMLEVANTVTPDAYLATGRRKRVNGKPVLTSMHERRIRRLTPTECERLQGFPDGWTQIPGMSDTQRYKMMGNAVTVNVIQALGTALMESVTE